MAIFTKQLLSGSTDGRQISVAANATPGTLIHTADATALDEIWLWAVNTDGSQVDLTVEFGGVTDPDDLIEVGLGAGEGLILVVPGWVLTNGLIVRAFASVADVVNIGGYVNRVTDA